MSGNLYQLKTERLVQVGDGVLINGPYDNVGYVVALRESGYHLIRGQGTKSDRPIVAECLPKGRN